MTFWKGKTVEMFENQASGAGWTDEAWHCGRTVLCVSVGDTWHSHLFKPMQLLQQQERTLTYSNLKIIQEVGGFQCGRQKGGAKQAKLFDTGVSNSTAGCEEQESAQCFQDTVEAKKCPSPRGCSWSSVLWVKGLLESTAEHVSGDSTIILMKCAWQGATFLLMEARGRDADPAGHGPGLEPSVWAHG